LKLKRHEQPPPGYFNSFPTHVINRLERNAGNGGVLGDASWLMRFMGLLETNPIAAGLFGMSLCGLLISGIAYSQSRPAYNYSGNSPATIDVADIGNETLQTPQVTRTASVDSFAPTANSVFTTNAAALFDGAQSLSVTPVNWQVNR
ncbi:MAG TPA: hypothetical protein VG754_03065, partial [Verrucomicrobiae bacterium]|nr:hypothetical protein [Verrucomicrobiae bacterium]